MAAALDNRLAEGVTSATLGRRAPAPTGALSWLTSPKALEGLRLQAFLVPIGIVFAVLFAIPLGQSLYFSFTDFNGYSLESTSSGSRTIRNIFTDPSMLAALGFTLLLRDRHHHVSSPCWRSRWP